MSITGKHLYLLLQRDLPDPSKPDGQTKNWVSYALEHVAAIDKLPIHGLCYHTVSGYSLFDGNLHSLEEIREHWKGFNNNLFKRVKTNWAVVNAVPIFDMFDDQKWANVVASAKNFAIVLKEVGIVGISADNECYHPVDYWKEFAGKSKDENWAKSRQRGRDVMSAFQSGYPGMKFFVLFSPTGQDKRTPSLVYEWSADEMNNSGAFTCGMLEIAKGTDANEFRYWYESDQEYSAAYQWLSKDISKGTPPSYISSELAANWANRVKVSGGTINVETKYSNNRYIPINPEILKKKLLLSAQYSDEFIWLFCERAILKDGYAYPTYSIGKPVPEGELMGSNFYLGQWKPEWLKVLEDIYNEMTPVPIPEPPIVPPKPTDPVIPPSVPVVAENENLAIESVSTNKPYDLKLFVPGIEVYIDRPSIKTGFFPKQFYNTTLVRSSNDDIYNSGDHLKMKCKKQGVIYVLFDKRAKNIPTWITDLKFVNSKLTFSTHDTAFICFAKAVLAGENITLGGNEGGFSQANSNYLVVFK